MNSRHIYSSAIRIALEPRLMFDGAAVATAAAALTASPHPAAAAAADATHHDAPAVDHSAAAAAVDHQPADANDTLNHALVATAPAHEAAARQEVYFIDSSLPDKATLVADLPAHADIVWLNPNTDGLTQIATALQGRSNIDAIHIITHASEGELEVGSTVLDSTSIKGEFASVLAEIGQHLSSGGDVLIYGCDLAAGSDGQATVQALADALTADVAASTDVTGVGGNWVLEDHVGLIQTQAIQASDWHHDLLLSVPVNDTATVAINTTGNIISVMNNDVIVLGATVNVAVATSPLHGTATVNADNTISYKPTAGYFGTDTFNYALKDGLGIVLGTASVTVTVLNDALPVIHLPTVTARNEDTTVILSSALGTALTVTDADTAVVKVTLSVPTGTLTLSSVAGLTFTQGNGTANAVMTIQGTQANINAAMNGLVYTPVPDFNGTVNLTVTATDNLVAGVTSILPIVFTAVPDAVLDTVSTPQNTAASFNVLSNDSFAAGRVVTAVGTAAHGSVTFDAQGNVVYTPTSGYSGSDTFTYTVLSGGVTETGTVNVNTYINFPPVITVPAAQTFAEDATKVFSSTSGNAIAVSDANGDQLTVTLASTHGSLTLSQTTGLTFTSGDGTADPAMVFKGSIAAINAALNGLSFSPVADYNGSAAISVQASDGIAAVQNASVALNVTAVADGITQTGTTSILTPVSFTPLVNDTFAAGAFISSVGSAAHGVVAFLGNTVTYTPAIGYSGTDTFTYTVNSGGTLETLSISVTVGDRAPIATGLGTLATVDGGLVAVPAGLAFHDPDLLDLLTYSASGLPAGLTIDPATGIIGGLVNTHASTVNGGIYNVVVTATDLAGQSATSALQMTVTNPAPIPLPGLQVGGTQNTLLNLDITALAIIDPDGDAIHITQASALHGTVTIKADGSLAYQPNASYYGLDAITYTVVDTDGGSAVGTVAVLLAGNPSIPTLQLPSIPLLNEDTPIIFANLLGQQLSVGNIDGGVLEVKLSVPIGSFTLTQTAGLTLAQTIDGNGATTLDVRGTVADINAGLNSLIYTPAADYNGPVNLTLNLGTLLGGILNVNAVLPISIAPVADIVNDQVNATLNTAASFNVLANDSFENPGRVVSSFTTPAHGMVTVDAQGNAVYTPNSGWLGHDSFTYTVTSNGTTETATVSIDTALPNYAPTVSMPATQTSAEDATLLFNAARGNALLVNDANGDTLTVTLSATHGALTLSQTSGLTFTSGDGTADASMVFRGSASAINAALEGLQFKPAADYNGSANVSLLASDGLLSQSASTTVTITPVADGVADNILTQPLVPVTFFPLANDTFSDPAAAITAVGGAAHGTVVLGLNGAVTYTPAVGYRGADSFTYTVTAGGVTEQIAVNVTVGTNTAPTSVPLGTATVNDGAVVLITAASAFNDSDLFDVLHYSASNLPAGLAIDPLTGIISGTVGGHASVQAANGNYNVVVTATDLAGASVTSTLQLHVNNPAPVTTLGLLTGLEDTPLQITTVLAVDPDGDTVTITGGTALHGTVTLNADHTLTYTPNADYNGADVITYSVVDADGATATGVISVNLIAVPDLPTLRLPSIPLLAEDTPIIFANLLGQKLSVGDVDGQVLDLKLSVPVGTFTLGTTAGLTLTQGTGTNDSTLEVHGTVADINAALNSLIYTPGADYNGNLDITLQLGQLIGGVLNVSAILPIGITPVADIVNDQVNATLNTPANFNVLANDTFENAGRAVSSYSTPSHGVVTIDAQGNATYTPTTGYLGSDSFTYTVTSNGTTETATVTINTALPNYAPTVSMPAAVSLAEDVPLTFSTAAGNALVVNDANGDTLTVTLGVTHGALTLSSTSGLAFSSGDGTADSAMVFTGSASAINAALNGLVFKPAADYNGSANLSLSASDGLLTQNANTTLTITPVTDGVADSITTQPLVPVTFYPLSNDSFSDPAAAITAVGGASHGTVVIGLGGAVTYTPGAGYRGADSFTYTVTAGGVTEQIAVNVVVGTNTPPTSVPLGSATVNDAAVVAIATAGAFSDGDLFDVLHYSASNLPAGLAIDPLTGIIAGQVGGHASQVANGNYTIVVTATDLAGASVTSPLQLHVNNPAPVTTPGLLTGLEDTPLQITTVAAIDPDGDTVTLTGGTALHGTVTLNADHTLTYTPNANYNGADTITYSVVDGDGATATGVIAVNLIAVPDLPTLQLPAIPLLAEDTPLIFANLLGQKLSVGDVDGQVLDLKLSVPVGTFTLGTTAGLTLTQGTGTNDSTLEVHGTVADINAALNSLIYTPGADYNGNLDITLQLGQLIGGVLNVSAILPVGITPVADIVDDHVSTVSGSAVDFNVLANDSFENAGRVVESFTTPTSGVVTLDAQGNAHYTPNSGFIGTDTFTYTVLSNGTHETATVTITVGAQPNTAPVATALPNVDANDGQTLHLAVGGAFTDADGDTLTYSATGLPVGITIDPATGLISGTLGGHASVQVTSGAYAVVVSAADGKGAVVSQNFTLSVHNPAPVAGADTVSTQEDTAVTGNVLSNDSDPDGDTLSVDTTPVQGPAHGLLVLNANGTFTYTPNANYNGADSFSYRVLDTDGGSAVATVSIAISAVNDAPTTSGTIATQTAVDSGTFSLDVSNRFSDVDGDALSYSASGLPTGLAINASTGVISGTLGSSASAGGPTANGVYTVNLLVSDGHGASVTRSFELDVSNPAPTSANVNLNTSEDTVLNGTLVANDPDGDALTFSLTQGAAHGSVTVNADGTFRYQPAANFNGSDSFTYQVRDADGSTVTATATVTVSPVNDAPQAQNDVATTAEDTPVVINVLANDSDVDGDSLSVTAASAAHGSVVINANGTLTYTPNADYNGTDTIAYTVRDPGGLTSSANVTVTITPVNDAPVSTPLSAVSANDSATLNIATASHFSDVDGDTLSYSVSGLPAGLSLNPVTGLITGTLGSSASQGGVNHDGQYSINVTANDGHGASTSQTFVLSVGNPAPTTSASTFATNEDTAVSGQLQANDVDGDSLTFSASQGPSHGNLVLNANGSFTYTPAANYNGSDSFTYQVRDADGALASAVVTLAIAAVNDAPTSTPVGNQSANDSATVSINAGGHFNDVDGDTLSFTASTLPAGLSIDAASGIISGTLGSSASQGGVNHDGVYSITVNAADGHGGTSSQTFVLSVANPVPTSIGASFSTNEDTQVQGTLTAYDADGDALTFSATQGPTHGSLALNSDGSFTYTPAANYHGADSFTYQVRDADGGVTTAVATLTILSVNDAPTGTAIGTQTANDSTTISINAGSHFSDVDGDTLSYSVSGLPGGLSIDPVSGLITGTLSSSASQGGPLNNGVYSVTVSVNDGNGATASQTFALNVSNPAPTTSASTFATNEDTAVTGQLQANDVDGDSLTFSATQGPAHGNLVLNPNGSFTYTPAANYNGTDSFTYQVRDADGSIATALVTLNVAAVNDAPTATLIGTQTANDSATVSINAGSHFSDVDGDTLAYSVSGLPAGLTLNPGTGLISGTLGSSASHGGPNSDGIYAITVTANDGHGGVLSQTFALNVSNPLPTTANASFAINEDTTLTGALLASDPDGDPLTFSTTQAPAHGSLVLNANGTFTYTPAANYNGADSFAYQVRDIDGGIATAVVSLSVAAVNDAPTSTAIGTQAGIDGAAVSINAGSHFSDVDGDTLSYTANGLPNGVSIDASTGLITGTLGSSASAGGAGGNGVYAITVSANDGHGGVLSQTFNLAVANTVPTTANATFSTHEDTPLSGNLVAQDQDGDALTFSTTQAPAHGSLVLNNDGSFTYTPAANYNGADSFTYQVRDADGAVVSAVVTLNVTPVNDAPATQNSTLATNEDTAVSGALVASDADGDSLSFSTTQAPAHGTLVLNANGTFTYTPAANYHGADSFTYQVSDPSGAVATAVVSLTVTPVNDAPTATPIATQSANDSTLVSIDAGSHFSDVDSSTLTYSLSGQPTGLTIDPVTGVVSGTLGSSASAGGPAHDGVYTLSVTANDGQGGTFTQTFNLDVSNTLPVSANSAFATPENVALTGALLATDADGDALTFSTIQGPTQGSLTLNSDGSFLYTPGANFRGNDSFTYEVRDADGAVVSAVVSLRVGLPNEAPQSTPVATQTASDSTPFSLDMASHFSDADGDSLAYSISGQPTGLVIDAQSGLISGNLGSSASHGGPNADGVYAITVSVNDGHGGTVSQTFNLDVSNPAPITSDSAYSTASNTAVNGTLLASDVDGDALTFSATQSPAHGAVTVNADGTFTYTPAAGYHGADAFTYQVRDADGSIATAVVTLNINDAPTTTPIGTQTANDSAAVSIDSAAHFSDLNGDALMYSVSGLPAGLSIDASTGLITGTLGSSASHGGANADGVYAITVSANDGLGGTVSQTFALDVSNPAPTSADSSFTTRANTAVSGTLLATDVDGDALTFSTVQAPTHGILTLNGDGTFTYTPSANYHGLDSFSYQVRDADGGVATAVVSLNVNNAPTSTAFGTQTANDSATVAIASASHFSDANGDSLTYTVSGLPAGLSIDPNTGLISGTLGSSASHGGTASNGVYAIVVTANDGHGGTSSQAFALNVSNPAPTTTGSSFTTAANTAVSGALVASDIDGDVLTFSTVNAPAHGGLSLNGDGTFTYTPASGYHGTDSFTYQVRDADGGLASAVVSLNVNDAPTTTPIGTQTANDATAVSINAASHFSDANGDPLTYSVSGLPAGLTINASTGLITGTLGRSASVGGPNSDGVYTITVSASDGHGGSISQLFALNVSNPLPVAANASFATTANTPVSGVLVASDVDGDALTFSASQGPLHGTVALNANGTFTYTPTTGYHGADTYTYQVRDADGGITTAVVTFAVNDAPTSTPIGTQSGTDAAPVSITTANHFSDVNGDVLTYSVSGLPAGLSINASTGLITGTLGSSASSGGPAGNGAYAITVTANDGLGGSVSQIFVLNISNPAPSTANTSFTTGQNTALSGVLVASDVDGDALTFSTTQAPTHGGLLLNADGTFTYTPAAGYHGNDSFTYQVRDADGAIATAVVSLNVNDAPGTTPIGTQAANDSAAVNIDTASHFSDLNGDSLAYSVSGLPAGLSINPVTGLITGTLGSSASAGGPNLNGVYAITVTANDGHGASVSQTFALDVSNPAPSTANASFITPENTVLTGALAATDADGDALAFSTTQAPAHGTLVLNANGTFTYTPATNYHGADSFTYQVRDADGSIASAVVTLNVNDAPTSTPVGTQNANDGATVSIGTASHFSDSNGDPLTYSVSGLPNGLSIDPGTGLITGTLGSSASAGGPTSNGVYSITVTANDGLGGATSQTFALDVSNPAPTSANSAFTTRENVAVSGTLVASDVDGDALTFSTTQAPAHGSLTLNADGTFTYTPATDYHGADSFAYQVRDADGGTVTAVVSLNVNDAPTSTPVGTQTANDGATVNIDIASHFSDANGDALAYSASGLPAGLSIDPASGLITGTLGRSASHGGPNTDGVYAVTVSVNDGHGGTLSQTFTLNALNPAPTSANAAFTTPENTALTGALVASDVDGDSLTFSATQGPAHGALTLNGDGTFSYTPTASYHGSDSFTYQVRDADGGLVSAVVTINVNDAPTSTPVGTQAANDGAPVNIDTASHFSDAEGDTLTYSASGLPAGVSINPGTGLITGTLGSSASAGGPTSNGVYSITVTANDGLGGATSQTFALDVSNPAPTTSGASFATNANTAVSGALLATDVDGDALTFSTTQAPAHGVLTLNGNGTFTYTPATNYSGVDSFTYQVRDADGGIASAVVTLNIGLGNAAPLTTPIGTQSANDSSAVSIDAASHFSDPDGNSLTYTAIGLPAGLSIDANTGLISGNLGSSASSGGPSNNGVYAITVTADDGHGGAVNQTFALDISNPAPTTAGSSVSTNANTAVTGQLLATDVDGDGLTFTASQGPVHGTVTVNANGSYTYTPASNYSGIDSFTYQVRDADGGVASAMVVISVGPLNGPNTTPIGTQSANDGGALTIDAASHFTDPNGFALTYTISGQPAGVTIDPNTGLISGTLGSSASAGGPNANGVYAVTVMANDGHGNTLGQTFALDISNPLPTTANASFSTAANTAVSGALVASDSDGDALTFSASQGPIHGSVTVNPNGTFTYTPGAGYSGVDTFTYQVRDADGGIATAVVTLNVGLANAAPVDTPIGTRAASDGAPVSINAATHFSDPDGDRLTYSATGLPAGVTIDANTGVITGTLGSSASAGGPNANGVYAITVTAADGRGGVLSQTFALDITNPAPVTQNSSVIATENVPYSGTLVATDPDGDALAFSVTQPPAHGSLSLNPNGGFTYTPSAGYSGPDSFTYQVRDADGGLANAVVSIQVSAVANQPPVVPGTPVNVSTGSTTPVTVPVGTLASDPDGDPLTVVGGSAGHGQVSVGPNGALVYTPDGTFTGTDVVTYVVRDSNGATVTGTLNVAVNDTVTVATAQALNALGVLNPANIPPDLGGTSLLIQGRANDYEPVLLAAVNGVKHLEGNLTLGSQRPLLDSVGGLGALGASTELQAAPVAGAVGDLNEAQRTPLDVDELNTTAPAAADNAGFSAAGSEAPAVDVSGATAQIDTAVPSVADVAPVPTLGEQLLQANARRVAEIEALGRLLAG
ncbi:Ig-like domain-containing protein [Pseudomonas sp. dw_358]|uniref:Ig-like domain-containing protein n=1 Tax=Pseudomonas sp. dw_358 TaxID=2720083 RepID=UPI001BD44B38|nr:Ig-like domain-containing protein [Pseudomonas sp. dw_358]